MVPKGQRWARGLPPQGELDPREAFCQGPRAVRGKVRGQGGEGGVQARPPRVDITQGEDSLESGQSRLLRHQEGDVSQAALDGQDPDRG